MTQKKGELISIFKLNNKQIEMRSNGTSTRAIDKAIQDFFTSPVTRREFKEGEPVQIKIPRLAVVNDCCIEESKESAEILLRRFKVEHNTNIRVQVVNSSVLIIETFNVTSTSPVKEVVEVKEEYKDPSDNSNGDFYDEDDSGNLSNN